MLLALAVALLVIAADQATKMIIVQTMQTIPSRDIPVINGILHLHLAQNSGAAFSMLLGMQWVFIIASSAASVAIIVFLALRKTPIHWVGLVSLGLIMGGALGNLFDRLRTPDHTVIDFIYVKFFAIFNVADSCITVGAILLSVYIMFMHEKYKKRLAPTEPEKTKEPEVEQA
jgi:signal peptidase II